MKKLDAQMVAEIAKLRALGFSQKEIADRFGVTQTTVSYHFKRLRELALKEGEDNVFRTIVASLVGLESGALLAYLLSQLMTDEPK